MAGNVVFEDEKDGILKLKGWTVAKMNFRVHFSRGIHKPALDYDALPYAALDQQETELFRF